MRNPVVTLVVGLVIGLIIAGGAYIMGMNAGQAQAQDQTAQFFRSRGADPNATGAGAGTGAGGFAGAGFAGRGAAGGAGGAGGTIGTISKVDGNTLTVTAPNQGDVTVSLPTDIQITKTVTGTVSDLRPGTQVLIRGQRSGNNVTATNIQITSGLADFFGGGGGRRAQQTPTP